MKVLLFIIATISSFGIAAKRIERCDASPNFLGSTVFYYPIGTASERVTGLTALAEFHYNFGTAYLRCFLNEAEMKGRCTGAFLHDGSERVELQIAPTEEGKVVARGFGTYIDKEFKTSTECKLN